MKIFLNFRLYIVMTLRVTYGSYAGHVYLDEIHTLTLDWSCESVYIYIHDDNNIWNNNFDQNKIPIWKNIIINGKIAFNDEIYLDPSKLNLENKQILKILIENALVANFIYNPNIKSKYNFISNDSIEKINNIKPLLRIYYTLII